MKPTLPWHRTPFGRLALGLGGLELAVPVMILVAAALAWGTYLDSAYGAKLAKARVYASWWFLGLMALVCVSLVFAVVTRYPWKRKHVGFITVHAGLIALIAGGFWSLFGRVEGQLMLQEGASGAVIETEAERLELVEHRAGGFTTVASTAADSGSGRLAADGLSLAIVERWPNTREETYVADDGAEPLRAAEIAFGAPPGEGIWVGEESRGGAAALHGVQVRVLAAGAVWEPPSAPAPPTEPGYAFVLGGQRYPLGDQGQQAVPGWTITSIRKFASAVVGAGGLTDSPSAPPNPAVEAIITDGKGTSERHTAFLNFPDMPMSKTIEGTARSNAEFLPVAAGGGESLVIYGDPASPRVGFVSADGGVLHHELSGAPPWSFDAGRHRVTVLRQFTRARVASRFVPAAPASERRPAVVVRAGETTVVAPWKGMAPVSLPGRNAMLRYGPRTVSLPFTVRLDDFRKLDYPGTEMAMAYESDVTMTASGIEPRTVRVFMNNPLTRAGWKVYQSGFVNDNISIFSVMKDPGLPLTYAGCIAVVLGIIVTFYSRAYSWGHPGIAVPFASKEPAHAAHRVDRPAVHPGDGPGERTLVGPPGGNGDPGRGSGDAPGHVREASGGATDRAVPVVG